MSHEEMSHFGEMAGRIAEKRTIIVIADASAVGLSQAEAATSGIWKKKRTLPLLLPPRDGAEGDVDDGGDGDGNDGNDGVARSKGGVVASVVIVIDDDDDDNDNDDDDENDGGDGYDDGITRSEGGIIASIVVVVDDDDDDDDDDGVAQS